MPKNSSQKAKELPADLQKENQEARPEPAKDEPGTRQKKPTDLTNPPPKASSSPAQAKALADARRDSKSGAREREDGEILVGTMAGKNWLIERRIAAGSFGTLFIGRHIHTLEPVAIKAERMDSSYPQLHRERKFYQVLGGGVNVGVAPAQPGIPIIYYFGECSTGHHYQLLIMELLGPNIEDLLQACGGKFAVKTTCMLAIQLLDRMEYIHSKGTDPRPCYTPYSSCRTISVLTGILYRDIKSENFLLGRRDGPNANTVFIVDFGLSKEYINPVSRQHVPFNTKKGSVGTPRYMSINALQHHEQGRRDDLEALSYLFLYLHIGHLPWQGLPGSTFAEKCKRILEKKLKLGVEDVCKGAPVEFCKFMKYSRTLEYEEKPDYNFCRQLFHDMIAREKATFDHVYDFHGERVADFWKTRNKLLGSLGPLPEDLQTRIELARRYDGQTMEAGGGRKSKNAGAASSRNVRSDRADPMNGVGDVFDSRIKPPYNQATLRTRQKAKKGCAGCLCCCSFRNKRKHSDTGFSGSTQDVSQTKRASFDL
ncbi:hypothetical protein RvY_06163 [Ramazzottius varieornatus]|uniref:non-specific serine/threonine protein kinase n=1 Tax=Ramazzottius varieornatus TaxID=947166 RepID=A0A1D1UY48_RAMVA|nr:hypothetical protein RvY_06163 [Ramazzottius varieornatus]